MWGLMGLCANPDSTTPLASFLRLTYFVYKIGMVMTANDDYKVTMRTEWNNFEYILPAMQHNRGSKTMAIMIH